VDIACEDVLKERPDFWVLDMEDTYGLPGATVSASGLSICAGVKKAFPKLRVGVYTSWNFIQGSVPQANSWLNLFFPHIAAWSDWSIKHTDAERHMPMAQIKNYPPATYIPLGPTAWANTPWIFHQYDTWQIPNDVGAGPVMTVKEIFDFDHQYDWNRCRFTLPELKAWCGNPWGVTVPPVPVPAPVPAPTPWTITINGSGTKPTVVIK
jgi:hypothetical protein